MISPLISHGTEIAQFYFDGNKLKIPLAAIGGDPVRDSIESSAKGIPLEVSHSSMLRSTRGLQRLGRYVRKTLGSYRLRTEVLPYKTREDERFLSMLAHDLRRPFTSLRVGLDLLKRIQGGDPAERERILFEIERICNLSCERAESLLAEILSTRGHRALKLEHVPILNFLKECVQEFVAAREVSPIEFKYFVNEQDAIFVDRSRMLRVFVNLIENAEQALERRREIWFESRVVSAGRIEIVVGNFGKPVGSEMRSKMFRPFCTDKEGGTGLGLAIAKEIVVSHRGEITYKTDRDHGTRFYIRLPKPTLTKVVAREFEDLSDLNADRSHKSSNLVRPIGDQDSERIYDATVQVNPLRVVVVEDSEIIRRSWECALGPLYYIGFSCIEDFVMWMSEQPRIKEILCVITDYYFDESSMTGGDLVKWMKENYRIPILVSTENPQGLPADLGAGSIGKQPLSMDEILVRLESTKGLETM